MQAPIITNLPKSQVEIKFEVKPEEIQPYLEQAAVDLQSSKPIPGFRPGKAPYEMVKKEVGDMKLYELALERIVRAKYVHTVLENSIETLGSPSISVEQMIPGQDLKFTVTVSVMPSVKNLISYEEPLVTKTVKEVKEEAVEKALLDLRKMRRTEVVADRVAAKDDMVLLNLEITKDGVQIEGGSSSNYKVYLNEPHYIPGFTGRLVGLKKGDKESFELEMPKGHYQKNFAGQKMTFNVDVVDVFEMKLPELNDEFAKGFGLESMEKLRALLKENLINEAEQKANEASEIELLEKMVKGSKFSEVPELLINEEVRRMYAELQHAAEDQGMKMEDYLSQLKKSADELKLDMIPRAIERVQTAVLMKEISKRENMEVTEKEIDEEIDRILDAIKDPEMKERITAPEYRDYVAAQMRNRKTLELLKKKGIKTE
ncbi:trigger factor [Patescibacteria group bacterium]|nr:trigger factor [Patescibacteria group bacterium]